MFKVKQLVWAMGCVSLLNACAWHQNKKEQRVNIKPVMEVKHASGTGNAEATYQVGRYYQGKSDCSRAIAAYETALEADPRHVEARNGLGTCYSLQGQFELALRHLRKAIELSPLATHLHNNLGHAYLVQGQKNEAIPAFERALQLDPENKGARNNLIALYERTGSPDKAAALKKTRSGPLPAAAAITSTVPLPEASAAALPALMEATHSGETRISYSSEAQLEQTTSRVFELRRAEADLLASALSSKTTGKIVEPEAEDLGKFASKDIRIEVSNGNGVAGMARQVSDFLQQSGFPRPRLTDWGAYQQPRTEIHYRPGHSVVAGEISRLMAGGAPLVESHNLRRDIQIRIVLGKDILQAGVHLRNL